MRIERIPNKYKDLYKGKWRKVDQKKTSTDSGRNIHIHQKLIKALKAINITLSRTTLKRGYVKEIQIKKWEELTGVKNEGDTPMSFS